MSLIRDLKKRRFRKKLRVKNKLSKDKSIPRLSVYKSLRYIYGQVVDDKTGNTLISCSSLELKNLKGNKKAIAKEIGLELAKRSIGKGINSIKFDRGRFLYHGRIRALADGLREGGLQF